MKIRSLLFAVFAIIYSLSSIVSSIGVSPSAIDAGMIEPDRGYDTKVYFLNSETGSYDISLKITLRSEYLSDCVTFSPKSFESLPDSRQEVNISIDTSACEIDPGVHTLLIMPHIVYNNTLSVNTVFVSTISIKFSMPGEVRPSLVLEEFEIDETLKEGEALQFLMVLNNTGNVRVGAVPFVDIRKYDVVIDVARGTTEILMDSGSIKEITFSYEDELQAGTYEAVAYVRYLDGNYTNEMMGEFNVEQRIQTEEKKSESDPLTFLTDTIDIGTEDDVYVPSEIVEQAVSTIYDQDETSLPANISIRNLTAKIQLGYLSIFMELENHENFETEYSAEFFVTDSSGTENKTIIQSGTLRALEVKVIRKSVFMGADKDYKVYTTLKYGSGTQPKMIQKEIEAETTEMPTALITGNYSKSSIYIIFLLIVMIYSLHSFKVNKSVKPSGALKSVSEKYGVIESDMTVLESKIKKIKNKIKGSA
ncbi:MAG: hypothetical protein GQ477_01755 [Nanohaloarchaea archaeon]|nr:hypothetical protein [Candidatus Nanohaloarchaea archaeon]